MNPRRAPNVQALTTLGHHTQRHSGGARAAARLSRKGGVGGRFWRSSSRRRVVENARTAAVLDPTGAPLPEFAVAVIEEARGQGIGRALVEAVAERTALVISPSSRTVHRSSPSRQRVKSCPSVYSKFGSTWSFFRCALS